MSSKQGEIHLSYFKQGDDMYHSLEYDDGKLNVKKSINNHIALLQIAIDKLTDIKNNIPDDNNLTIEADTHMISISGDDEIINNLEALELVTIDKYNEDCEEQSNEVDDDNDELNENFKNAHFEPDVDEQSEDDPSDDDEK
jgi:hypothetical protein